jgi:hypothetical protein
MVRRKALTTYLIGFRVMELKTRFRGKKVSRWSVCQQSIWIAPAPLRSTAWSKASSEIHSISSKSCLWNLITWLKWSQLNFSTRGNWSKLSKPLSTQPRACHCHRSLGIEGQILIICGFLKFRAPNSSKSKRILWPLCLTLKDAITWCWLKIHAWLFICGVALRTLGVSWTQTRLSASSQTPASKRSWIRKKAQRGRAQWCISCKDSTSQEVCSKKVKQNN